MALSERENTLRTIRRENPEWIPMQAVVSGASRRQWGREMEEVMARHPLFFAGVDPGKTDWEKADFGPVHRPNEQFTDNWGVVWDNALAGLEGLAIEHPLADWSALETWRPPHPLELADRGPANWETQPQRIREQREQDKLVVGGVPHGFLLMRMWYLRGFEALMMDFALEDPHLQVLIDLLVEQNAVIVEQWLKLGVDMMSFPEDLGTQQASIISPAMFRRWITPAYTRLIEPCKAAGVLIHQHSDGYVMGLIDEFIASGRDVVNLQDLCNGIDDIAAVLKGRVCIDLDIDRQKIVPFGKRAEIRELIAEEVRKLGSARGGLMMVCGIYPPTPPENVDALCSALEEYRTWWWDGRGG